MTGALRIADLAERCGLGCRQLERRLVRAVGLNPKPFAAMLRCDRAARRLRGGMGAADAAFEAGYADRSPMHRAFQRDAGLTPQRYARDHTTFFQDTKAWQEHEHEGPRHA